MEVTVSVSFDLSFHYCQYRASISVGPAGGTWQIMAAAVGFQVQEFSFAPPYKKEAVQTGFLSEPTETSSHTFQRLPIPESTVQRFPASGPLFPLIPINSPNNSPPPQPHPDVSARDRHIFSLLSQLTLVLQLESRRDLGIKSSDIRHTSSQV